MAFGSRRIDGDSWFTWFHHPGPSIFSRRTPSFDHGACATVGPAASGGFEVGHAAVERAASDSALGVQHLVQSVTETSRFPQCNLKAPTDPGLPVVPFFFPEGFPY